jgi:structure-specific recognition protein 1
MRVLMKSETEHSFTSIPKEEAEGIRIYLQARKCHIVNELDESAMQVDMSAIMSDEDEDMASVAGTDDGRRPVGADDDSEGAQR